MRGTPVEVPEHGFDVDDGLAVDFDFESPQTVGHRVLGTHRNPHLCHRYTSSLDLARVDRLTLESLRIVVHLLEIVVAQLVLLLQWMVAHR